LGLDLLLVEEVALSVDEHQQSAILSDHSLTMTGVDLELREEANFSFDNHSV
jgi:hypothetical protein